MRIYIDDTVTLKQMCEKVNRMRPPANVKRLLDSILEQLHDADEKAAEEVENLDRIVHGEVPRPTRSEAFKAIRTELEEEAGKDLLPDEARSKPPIVINHGRLEMVSFVSGEEGIGEVTLVDTVSPHPNDWIVDALADTSRTNPWREYNNELRAIEGFSKYVINRRGQVFLKATEETVGQMKGSKYTTVLLSNDDGITKRMVVEILVKNAFPEHAK